MSRATPVSVVLDFETTGLDPSQAEILEIGAIRIEGLTPVGRYSQLVRPRSEIPLPISQLTGIWPEMVQDAPRFEDIAAGFGEFLGDAPIIAHNSQLEASFLKHYLTPITGRTYELHNSILPFGLILAELPSHSLESLRVWGGVELEGSHRALKDCEDTVQLLQAAQSWLRSQRLSVARAIEPVLCDPRFGSRWWWEWLFALPEELRGPQLDLAALLSSTHRGDLRALKSEDQAHEPDYSKLPAAERLAATLVGGAESVPGFELRETQRQMALAVRDAIADGRRVAIEAPTGTGKSLGYLLPGVLAAGALETPVVISTHSKSLQDQLLEKDIPLASRILGQPIAATTVKGQENYVCLRKLEELTRGLTDDAPWEDRWGVAYLLSLTLSSRLAELDRTSAYLRREVEPLSRQIDAVRSHFTTTIGPPCRFYESCHFFGSARLAHQSDVIIANQALTFAWPTHLPKLRDVVFDEAHHLEDQLTEAHTERLSSEDITDTLSRLSRRQGSRRIGDAASLLKLYRLLKLPELALDPDPWVEHVDLIRTRLSELKGVLSREGQSPSPARGGAGRVNTAESDLYGRTLRCDEWSQETRVAWQELIAAMRSLERLLSRGVEACENRGIREDFAVDLLKLYQTRLTEYVGVAERGIDREDGNGLRLLQWLPNDSNWKLSIQPISVAELGKAYFASLHSVTLTSATLSPESQRRTGLELAAQPMALASPFELERVARVYFPTDLDPPGTPAHLDAMITFAADAAKRLEGRTLLLVTSNRRLRIAADALRERLQAVGIQVFDSLSDRRAAEGFARAQRAILVGGERYGEGLNIPGPALSLVIIEKVNESMTRGPLAQARKDRVGNALFEYDFPLRMMWLKQRVGRLIRSQEDRGLIVVLDSRVHNWSPPSRAVVQRALAPIPVFGGTQQDVLERISAFHAEFLRTPLPEARV